MSRSFFRAALVLVSCLAIRLSAADAPVAGEKSAVITCKKQSKFSYVMYFPKSYDAARAHKWPVMFIFSPGGGSAKTLDLYVEGAERNQFLLAVSVQSKNGNSESTAACEAMMDDVLASYPVNPQRCYASGFSGGSRQSFEISGIRSKNIIGILACGAGCSFGPFNKKAAVYGLCGTKCFNRWDMTITFEKQIKKNGVLRFFPAGHAWGDKVLIAEGMDWLNAQYLAAPGSGTMSAAAERKAFIARIAEEMQANLETRPVYAYERGMLLEKFTGLEVAKIKGGVAKLAIDPKVKAHLAAAKDVDQFAKSHFNTSVMDYKNKPVTKPMKQDAARLHEKHKDTAFGELFVGFGQPCVKP